MKILIAYDGSGNARTSLDDLRSCGLPIQVEIFIISISEIWLSPKINRNNINSAYGNDISQYFQQHSAQRDRNLAETSESVPEVNLTSLKQPFHSLKATHIKANLTDWQFLQSIYQNVAPVISKLGLSGEAIRFYAQTVHKTDAFHMARRQDTSRYLYLLAFVAYQSFRLQDMLVDSLLQSVQNATNAATQEYRGQYFQKRLEQRKTLNDLLKSLQTQVFPTFDIISKVLADKESSALRKLERIETSMNENLLERQRLESEIERLANATEGDRDDKEFYAILQKKSLTLQRRASDIICFLKVDEKTISQPLFDALRNFQKRDGNIEKNAPKDFLSSKEKEFFDENKFSVSLYKALLFQNIAGGIKSGTVNFNDSHKYRSLNDYLIPKAVWKNKSPELLRKSDLQSKTFPHEILQNLTKQTANAFRRTNRNLSVNEYFKSKEKGSWTIVTPKEDSEFALPLRNYFTKRQITPLSEVLATVGQATDFLDEFTHLQTIGNRKKPPGYVFFAGIVALGCELGVAKITHTSKELVETKLENTVNWYFTLENLRNANKQIVDFLASFELPNLYLRNRNQLHTSSDGQKYEVSVPSLNANYSYKYFGQNKGVSVYSFIDERHLLFY